MPSFTANNYRCPREINSPRRNDGAGHLNGGDLVALQEALYQSKNPSRRYLHVTRRDWIMGRIQKYRPGRPGSALEVGPGSGVYIPCLLAAAGRVTVSDCEPAYLEHVAHYREKGVTLVRDDITRTRMLPDSADLILCTEVIEHIRNSRAALAGLYRILKPGGALILTTPQRYSPLELLSKVAYLPGIITLIRRIYREPVLKAGHINLMTETQLKQQVLAAGFDILEQHKTGVYLPLAAELTGRAGLALARLLEKKIKTSRLDTLLWTQYYVLTKPGDGVSGSSA